MQILLAIFIFLICLAGIEIYSITWVAGYLGFWDTVIIILVTGVIGAFIARKNAKEALRNLVKGDFRNAPPGKHMFDAVAFFIAAALLLIPGLITDLAGIILLIPFTRNLIYKRLTRGKVVEKSPHFSSDNSGSDPKRDTTLGADEVIDIEAEDVL